MTISINSPTRVSPIGYAPSEFMIIGDTPSIEDLRKRKVLTGKSGDELWHILRRFAWIDKEDCYATNAILHAFDKPEKSLTEAEWIDIRRSLITDVERVNPSVILTLGNIPTHALLPETVGHDLETVNALPFRYYLNTPRGESIVIPSFHPSASFRDSSKLGFLINAVKAVRETLQGRLFPVILAELQTEITPVSAHTRLHDTLTALDTEWTTDGSTYIVSLSSHEGKAACVYPREDPVGAMQIAAHVRRLGVTTLLHNALADLPTLAQVGIYPRKWLDTMTVAFLLQYLPLSLKELSYRVLNKTMREYKDVIGEYQDLSEVPDRDSVDQYAASDPDATLRLHNALLPLWYPRMDEVMERDMAIHSMISEMMRHGMPLNIDKLSELDQKLAKINLFRRLRIEQIAKQYGFTTPLKGKKYAGMTFNPGSKKQVAELLYDRMQLGRSQKIDKTKSNRLSAGKKMLAKFKDEHEVVNMLNAWTETETLRTHFIGKLPTFIKEDNHIHTDISMTRIPHSGRFACSKPNLMAIPVRSDDGREIRKAFVAEPGWVFISNDLSQIEMRVLAHVSQDETMLRVFRDDGDIHAETGFRIFGLKKEEQDDYKHRLPSKTCGFGMANIIGANSLSRELINAGAGKEWDAIKAQELIDAWLRAYPGVKNHFDTVMRFITNYGFVLDMWGRREYIPQIYSCNERTREEGHRIACNQILQSGAQQMMKVMMAAVWEGGMKDWVKNNICYPLLQIHDDLVVYCREERAGEVSKRISQIMSIAPEWFSVPVKSEAKIGPSWGEMKKVS